MRVHAQTLWQVEFAYYSMSALRVFTSACVYLWVYKSVCMSMFVSLCQCLMSGGLAHLWPFDGVLTHARTPAVSLFYCSLMCLLFFFSNLLSFLFADVGIWPKTVWPCCSTYVIWFGLEVCCCSLCVPSTNVTALNILLTAWPVH